MALRPRFSTSLPFRFPALSNNKAVRDLKHFGRISAKNMPLEKRQNRRMVKCFGSNRPDILSEDNWWKNKLLFEKALFVCINIEALLMENIYE